VWQVGDPQGMDVENDQSQIESFCRKILTPEEKDIIYAVRYAGMKLPDIFLHIAHLHLNFITYKM
jgi:hypothetical protein